MFLPPSLSRCTHRLINVGHQKRKVKNQIKAELNVSVPPLPRNEPLIEDFSGETWSH